MHKLLTLPKLIASLLLVLLTACSSGEMLPTIAALPQDSPRLDFWQTERGTLDAPDAVDYWHFLGAAGERITLRAVERGAPLTITLFYQGVQLAQSPAIELELPQDGRYDVQVRLTSAQTGDYDIGLGFADREPPRADNPIQNIPQVVGVPTPTPAYTNLGAFVQQIRYGDDVGSALTSSSPQHIYTFEGTAGTYITLNMTRVSGTLDPFLTIYAPDGRPIALDDNSGEGRNARLRNIRLEQDGLYTVQVQGDSLYGDYRLRLEEGFERLVPDAAPTAQPTSTIAYATPTLGPVVADARLQDHVPVIGSLARAGDFQRFSFAANAGDLISVHVAPYLESTLRPQIEVFDAEGSLRASAMASSAGANGAAFAQRIPVAGGGLYSVIVTGEGESQGAFTIAVGKGATARDEFKGVAASNNRYDSAITDLGQRHSWLIQVRPGDVITAAVSTRNGELDPVVQIATVDGVVLYQDDNSGNDNSALIRVAEIVGPATYLLHVFDAGGRALGEYTMLWRYVNIAPTPTMPPAVAAILSVSDAIAENQYGFYVFQGQAGQTIQISATAQEGSTLDPVLALLDPAGQVIAQADDSDGTLNPRLTITLPVDGTYNVRVNGYLSRGAFDLDVSLVFNGM